MAGSFADSAVLWALGGLAALAALAAPLVTSESGMTAAAGSTSHGRRSRFLIRTRCLLDEMTKAAPAGASRLTG
jgi:hypothetical protein